MISVDNCQFFPLSVYFVPPLKGLPLELVSAQGSEKTRMMGLPKGQKRFMIGVVV